jgi:hypothetical protein
VELQLWGGYNEPSGTRDTSVAHASADITVATGLARARIWPLERHSVVVDTGLGVTHYAMSASGRSTASSNLSDAIDYKRSKTPMLGVLGAKYGYRTNSMFRMAVVLGVMLHATKMGEGTVTSSGSFTEADRYDLRVSLDDLGDELTKVRGYGEASVGFLF